MGIFNDLLGNDDKKEMKHLIGFLLWKNKARKKIIKK